MTLDHPDANGPDANGPDANGPDANGPGPDVHRREADEPAARHALAESDQHFTTAVDGGPEAGDDLGSDGAAASGHVDERLRSEISSAVLGWMNDLEDLPRAGQGPGPARSDLAPATPGQSLSEPSGDEVAWATARTSGNGSEADHGSEAHHGVDAGPPGVHEPQPSPSGSRVRRLRQLYVELSERGGRRVAVALVGITVAYHYSLVTLMRTLDVDTPLAYLGLVPFIALILGAARHAAPNHEPPIHDRQLDYIVGVPLMIAAFVMVALLPVRLSTLFWVWRVDLLSLPLFVAGTVSIVFGVRALWRLRLPIGFLLLAWPVPYTWFLDNWLQDFTDFTIGAVRMGVGVVGVARFVPGPNGIFAIPYAEAPFQVSVASACSGVNSMVGFLLVGSAFAALVRGRRFPKLAWLFGGLVLIWALNVFRILAILAIGRQWGEGVAIDGFHPVLGLVTFSFGVLTMILVMPRFGLRMVFQRQSREAVDDSKVLRRPSRPAVPRARLALCVVAAAAVLLATANSGLRDYELVADDLGQARLAAFSEAIPGPQGWTGYQSDSYTWAKRYFGDESSWRRYLYASSAAPGASAFQSPSPVITDVISTSDLSSFSTYGLEACYNFHGYRLYSTRDVDLGGGITGKVLSYYHPKLKRDWTSVYWHWPVRAGGEKRFERVVMMMVGTEQSELTAPAPRGRINLGLDVTNRLQGAEDKKLDQSLERTGNFLVSFAQETVSRHGDVTAVLPAAPVVPA